MQANTYLNNYTHIREQWENKERERERFAYATWDGDMKRRRERGPARGQLKQQLETAPADRTFISAKFCFLLGAYFIFFLCVLCQKESL